MPRHFEVEDYSGIDKRVHIRGPLDLYVDNDDVPTDQNAVLIKALEKLLNSHWKPVFAWFCENEDCESYGSCVEQANHDHDGICFYCHADMSWQEVNF